MKFKLRDILFWVHLSAGLTAGSIILIMSVTGVLLAFEPQIVDFSQRNVQYMQPPLPSTQKLGINTIVAQAKQSKPGSKPASVTVRPELNAAITVGFGKDGALFINPYTADVLGTGSKVHAAMHIIEDWHRWLGNRDKGRPITGICNIAFFILAVTGFYLWLPQNLRWPVIKAALVFNPKLKAKARDWNWHNVIGFWLAPFLIIITVSGIIMSYPWANDLLYRMAGSVPPPARVEQQPVVNKSERPQPQEMPPVDLDKIFVMAQEQIPAWVAMTIRLPQKPNTPITVSIEEKGYLFSRSQLTLDAATGEVKKWEPVSEQSKGRVWRTWARYLHTGEAGGFVGQFIAMVVSAGACLLVWTGFAMAWRRFFCKRIA